MAIAAAAILLLSIGVARGEFHPTFDAFLQQHYGTSIASRLARRDLGGSGSFGGQAREGWGRADQQAVILVHGITNTAGSFRSVAEQLQRNGHREGSIYATSFGDGGKTMAPFVDMKCRYVKQVRMLIQSVAAFTRRKVDVIAYSMGAPIARKAILGGRCVDTNEYLGPSLTGLVDTFVSVAGANRGSMLCFFPFPAACNTVNGLNCNSVFLADINSRPRYEADYIFSIYSTSDDKIGYMNTCGQVTGQIAGQNAEFVRPGNHDTVMQSTWPLQMKLIDRHSE